MREYTDAYHLQFGFGHPLQVPVRQTRTIRLRGPEPADLYKLVPSVHLSNGE